MKNWKTILRYFLLVIYPSFISIRAVTKFLDLPETLVGPSLLVFYSIVYYIASKIKSGDGQRKVMMFLLGIGVVTASVIIYPIIDGLKEQGLGSDQDDAIWVVIKNIFNGARPYDTLTYLGNKPSPGPGMIIWALPFYLINQYALMIPITVAITTWIVQTRIAAGAAFHWVFYLVTPVMFWELMFQGSDFILIGCAICIAFVLFKDVLEKNNDWLLISVLVFIATSRTVLFFVPIVFIYAFLLLKVEAIRKFKFVFRTLSIIAFIHTLFYFWSAGNYTPLHLFEKFYALIEEEFYFFIIGTFILSVAFLLILKRFEKQRPFILVLYIALPFILVAVLERRSYSMSYLFIPYPLLAYNALHLKKRRIHK